MRKLRKRLLCVGLAGMLALSCSVTALAADMTPGQYVFIMALRACGVSLGNCARVCGWQDAFEGYLEKTGNQALLNQLKGYAGLSWGDTAQGVDSLYWAVREWVSSSSADVRSDSLILYELPSSPAPQLDLLLEPGQYTVNTTPFSGPPAFTDEGYTYLFSDGYFNGQNVTSSGKPFCSLRNVYAPSGVEVFGVFMGVYSYESRVKVEFFTPDSSSSTGYRHIDLKSSGCGFTVPGGALVNLSNAFTTWNWNGTAVRTVMNYPFKIFGSLEAAEAYCKTGTVSNLFSKETLNLSGGGSAYGTDLELVNREVISIDAQMPLPGDATAAGVSLGSVSVPLGLEELSASLKAGGLQIEYDSAQEAEPIDSIVTGAVSSITDTVFQSMLTFLPWAFLIFGIVFLVFLFLKIFKRMTADS